MSTKLLKRFVSHIDTLKRNQPVSDSDTENPSQPPMKKSSLKKFQLFSSSNRKIASKYRRTVNKLQALREYNSDIQEAFKKVYQLSVTLNMVFMRYSNTVEQYISKLLELTEITSNKKEFFENAMLPDLTDSMLTEVRNVLKSYSHNKVLVEDFGLRVTRKDLQTLAGLNWLNDVIVNFYMNLLVKRSGTGKYPVIHAMNTFFYPKLLTDKHESVQRWTRYVDIFSKQLIAVPVHFGMHWCMAIIDFRDKSIRYYDSMGKPNQKCLDTLKQYLVDESLNKKKELFDTSNWTLENMTDIPKQKNSSDCGVFACTFAEFICANRELTFSQDNMPYFRTKMIYEILNVELLQ